jgi:hypothetical protein
MTDLGAFENEEIVVDDVNRDGYGFALRPQHIQRYREYANIYKVWQTHIKKFSQIKMFSVSDWRGSFLESLTLYRELII